MMRRPSGPAFAFLMPGADGESANVIAERIQAGVGRPIEIDGQRLAVEASIGIAVFPAHGQDGKELCQRADVAMYASKRRRTAKPDFRGIKKMTG